MLRGSRPRGPCRGLCRRPRTRRRRACPPRATAGPRRRRNTRCRRSRRWSPRGTPGRAPRARRRSTRVASPRGRRARAPSRSGARGPRRSPIGPGIWARVRALRRAAPRRPSRSRSRARTSGSETGRATSGPAGAARRWGTRRRRAACRESRRRRRTRSPARAAARLRPTSSSGEATRRASSLGGAGRGLVAVRVAARELFLDHLVELDRPDGVLVRKLLEDLVDDPDHVGLVVAEVVEQRAQCRMRDLELRRGQLEVVMELSSLRSVGAFVAHGFKYTALSGDSYWRAAL